MSTHTAKPTHRILRNAILTAAASACLVAPAAAQTAGFVDDFSGPDTNGWFSRNINTNPGTGGVGGAGDGYLDISQFPDPSNFGTHNDGPNYAGNWTAAGITAVSFYLNDVNTDELFSFHLLITGDEFAPAGETSFQYNPGFDPPSGSWQQYTVDFSNPSDWTRIRGESSFEAVLAEVADLHFRHDKVPFIQTPDTIAGDIGIDNITLVPAPGAITVCIGLGLAAGRRRQRA